MGRSKNYRVENISGQVITISVLTASGERVEDSLLENEIVTGVNEIAVSQLKMYENWGLIKITESTDVDDKVRWLVEGF